MASCPRPAMSSGAMTSASSGTDGCSLRVRMIINGIADFRFRSADWKIEYCRLTLQSAICNLQSVDALHLHRVVVERYRVVLLKQRPQVVLDRLIVGAARDKLAASDHFADVALLDDDLPRLDDVALLAEHPDAARVLVVDAHVGIGTDAEVSLLP